LLGESCDGQTHDIGLVNLELRCQPFELRTLHAAESDRCLFCGCHLLIVGQLVPVHWIVNRQSNAYVHPICQFPLTQWRRWWRGIIGPIHFLCQECTLRDTSSARRAQRLAQCSTRNLLPNFYFPLRLKFGSTVAILTPTGRAPMLHILRPKPSAITRSAPRR